MAALRKLSEEEIQVALAAREGWSLAEGKLHRSFEFDDFVSAFGFMASIALMAESMNHHPEWSNVYNRVVIDLATHDVNGISAKDFELAEKIDALAARTKKA